MGFKEIKEVNTTEEDTKGQISEQIDFSARGESPSTDMLNMQSKEESDQ